LRHGTGTDGAEEEALRTAIGHAERILRRPGGEQAFSLKACKKRLQVLQIDVACGKSGGIPTDFPVWTGITGCRFFTLGSDHPIPLAHQFQGNRERFATFNERAGTASAGVNSASLASDEF
jgi:hypothetical protein